MPAERFYINTPLQEGGRVLLKETEFHHLSRVMRARVGDTIELVNGKGSLAEALVQEISKDCARLIISSIQHETPRSTRIILAQAIPKPNRLEFILEKGTELGVDEFWLFPGQLSLKKDFASHQVDRLQAVTISSMKQCGRLFLPAIISKPSLEKWTEFPSTIFFGDTEPAAPLFLEAWKEHKPSSTLIFCVGPESGFTDKEVALLKSKGAQGVKLHHNILRTDTASLVALSLMEYGLSMKSPS